MTSTTTQSLIAAGSGLGGAIIGAVVTIATDRIARRHQVVRDNAEHERVVEDAKRTQRRRREETAAEEIDQMISVVADENMRRLRTREGWDDAASERTRDALLAANSCAAYLPTEMRDRVTEYLSFLENAEELTQWGAGRSGTTIWNARRESHDLIAAFLRFEELPPESEWLRETRGAAGDLVSDREEMYQAELEYNRTRLDLQ